MASLRLPYLLATLFIFSVNHVLAIVLLEDGYEVTTVINGDEHQINPYSILPVFQSSDLIVLDSSRSTFYTISFASSEGVEFKKLAGNGAAGYTDGELGSAMFNKPKSFAVDFKGNVYVADRFKHTIRKISKSSGVSTIAGGYSHTTGKKDGPAQNASFSDDFELSFIPEKCAIMISDHGNRLVREMKLKAEDCTHSSHSGVVGMTSYWVLGLVLSCLLGLVIGFVGRPYVTTRQGGLKSLTYNMTWNRCLTSLEKRVVMLCFVIRNAVVNSTFYVLLKKLILLSLKTIPLMIRVRKVERKPNVSLNSLPSLLDSDYTFMNPLPLLDATDYSKSCEMTKLSLDSSLRDLMIFDDVVKPCDVGSNTITVQDEDHVSAGGGDEKIERLIRANMFGFMEQTRTTLLDDESLDCCNGQIKLKSM